MRIVVSFLTLVMATDEQTLFFTPDTWCGFLASGLIHYAFDFMGFKAGLLGSSNIGGGAALGDGFLLFREVFFYHSAPRGDSVAWPVSHQFCGVVGHSYSG